MNVPRPPILWTDKSTATLGASSAPWLATGVSIDTRTIVPGDLFIALRGPNFDGHNFAAQAVEAGAVAIMATAAKADGLGVDIPVLAVNDSMSGLQDLARLARARTSAQIIGVTGSVGKTSTKEALRLALSAQGRTYATEGNLNNHWGLPLSLARLPVDADFGVFEMGMSAPGEIAPLSRMARPHAAIITTVAEVHAEFFHSVEQIADAKAEIFDGVDDDGAAVLFRDHPLFGRLRNHARRQGVQRIIGFGENEEAKVRLVSCDLAETYSTVEAEVAGQRVRYTVGAPGKHFVINSLAVLAAVNAIGMDVLVAAASLGDIRALKGRGQRQEIFWEGGAFVMIDESYNASPASMEAAISLLATAMPIRDGRRIAVMGDMFELGARSEELHAGLVQPLRAAGIDLVFTAGTHMASLWCQLPSSMRGGHAATAKELAPLVMAALGDGDVAMVKGSLSSHMAVVVDALEALDGAAVSKVVNGE